MAHRTPHSIQVIRRVIIAGLGLACLFGGWRLQAEEQTAVSLQIIQAWTGQDVSRFADVVSVRSIYEEEYEPLDLVDSVWKTRLKPGRYFIDLFVPGAMHSTYEISVPRIDRLDLVLGVFVGTSSHGGPRESTVRISVTPPSLCRGSQRLWAKMVTPLGVQAPRDHPQLDTVRLGSNCTGTIGGLEDGPYVVMVFRGDIVDSLPPLTSRFVPEVLAYREVRLNSVEGDQEVKFVVEE